MENKKPQLVTLDSVEYDANTFNEAQLLLLNHCIDLERKIGSTKFQLQQLEVGKDSFLRLLKAELDKPQDADIVG